MKTYTVNIRAGLCNFRSYDQKSTSREEVMNDAEQWIADNLPGRSVHSVKLQNDTLTVEVL